jgi:hypothetical protein
MVHAFEPVGIRLSPPRRPWSHPQLLAVSRRRLALKRRRLQAIVLAPSRPRRAAAP